MCWCFQRWRLRSYSSCILLTWKGPWLTLSQQCQRHTAWRTVFVCFTPHLKRDVCVLFLHPLPAQLGGPRCMSCCHHRNDGAKGYSRSSFVLVEGQHMPIWHSECPWLVAAEWSCEVCARGCRSRRFSLADDRSSSS